MKIKTPQCAIINVSIRKANGGRILLMSEEAAESGCKGRVVLADKHEIDLLKSDSLSGISVSDDFIATDTYNFFDIEKKRQFWMTRNAAITINPENGNHLVNGQGSVKVTDLLIKHNEK